MWVLIDIDNPLDLTFCYTEKEFKNIPEYLKVYYKKL